MLKIIITRTHRAQSGAGLALANSVRLQRDGEIIAGKTVFQNREWSPTALNQLRQPGAMVSSVDRAGIDATLAALRAAHPEFDAVPVQDNTAQ